MHAETVRIGEWLAFLSALMGVLLGNFGDQLLYVATRPMPSVVRPAQGDRVMEIGMLCRYFLKIALVVDFGFMPGPIN